MARKHDIKLLATNDSHYTLEEDAATHNVMMATQYGNKLTEHDAWPSVFFMRDMKQMHNAFKALEYLDPNDVMQAMLCTIRMADKVNIEKPEFTINLPSLHEDDERYLVDCCLKGWEKKLKGKLGRDKYPEYRKRLVYELKVIKDMGFVRYFLMVEDVIRWARSRGILVGPARGSAAGSLICYLMDITQVDPIRFELYFERFLNPERADLPDIDVDFQDNRREEVFQYIVNQYGQDKVARINTFNTTAIKGALKDVARAYGINPLVVNGLTKQLEEIEDYENVPELRVFANNNPELVRHAKRLNGVIRGTGVHACGICISATPIENSCVMEHRKDGVMVSNWDKNDCETFGLLKMDILGLTTLSIHDMCAKLVKRHYGIEIDYENPDLTDEKTLKAFAAGETACVFQFDGDGMQDLLKSISTTSFEVLTAANALYRPGPLNAGLTSRYVKIARGDEYPYYPHEALEPILEETHSIIVYQEQIMRIFNELAGFSWAKADGMRKIISKKLGDDVFEMHRTAFINGCSAKGIDEKVSGTLFDQMKEFAAYSFNKSHACAYSILSFWSMCLKVNFPGPFLASVMSNVTREEQEAAAIREARRLGVPVRQPDINISTSVFEYDTEDNAIVAPLQAVKGVGEKAVRSILEAREAGVFLSVDDMVARVNRRVVNKGVVDKMMKAGVFESLGVREANQELREKQMAELLPAFDSLPTLNMIRSEPVDRAGLAQINAEVKEFAEMSKKEPLPSVEGRSPVLMIINSQMKGESKLSKAKGTAPFVRRLNGMNIPNSAIYYASPIKVYLENPRSASKDMLKLGLDWTKREILCVKPKLIYCCTADAVGLFVPGGKVSKLYGQSKYNKEYDAYVLFGPSPQFAGYRPEDAGVKFEQCVAKIVQMFEEVNYDVR